MPEEAVRARCHAEEQKPIKESTPANFPYRNALSVENAVLCIEEPCGLNEMVLKKMFGAVSTDWNSEQGTANILQV